MENLPGTRSSHVPAAGQDNPNQLIGWPKSWKVHLHQLGLPHPQARRPKGKAGLLRLAQGLQEGSRILKGAGGKGEWDRERWGMCSPIGGS